eukprot:3763778-Rhodomonas_salina.4
MAASSSSPPELRAQRCLFRARESKPANPRPRLRSAPRRCRASLSGSPSWVSFGPSLALTPSAQTASLRSCVHSHGRSEPEHRLVAVMLERFLSYGVTRPWVES